MSFIIIIVGTLGISGGYFRVPRSRQRGERAADRAVQRRKRGRPKGPVASSLSTETAPQVGLNRLLRTLPFEDLPATMPLGIDSINDGIPERRPRPVPKLGSFEIDHKSAA